MIQSVIDLRSDTVTKPGKAMLELMMQAELGDDVFGEDPTVNALQTYAASLFGMEDALFCASGTQTNQIAIKLHTRAGDEVVCDALSHIYLYEGGGIAYNSRASARLIHTARGMFTASDLEEQINDDNVHFPRTSLVSIENTVNKGGGACWDFKALEEIAAVCKRQGLAYHLDGARLFNAMVARNESPKAYGQLFDTISICLSKGLGAPVGSLLLGSREHIYQARRIRKVLGGGMRQAGILAAAGLYALQNNVERLAEDHLKAGRVEDVLKTLPWIDSILPAETNILIFSTRSDTDNAELLRILESNQIKAVGMGKQKVRFVFHLDQSHEQIDRLCDVLKHIQL